jgi:hypothetical protein
MCRVVILFASAKDFFFIKEVCSVLFIEFNVHSSCTILGPFGSFSSEFF